MIVIAVGQNKGGVGKTTISVNLAGALNHLGRHVQLIDADPQGAASQWDEARQLNFDIRKHPITTNDKMSWIIDVLKTDADVVIVDLPAGFSDSFDAAVAIADLLIIPCVPSSMDIRAAKTTLAKAQEIREACRVSSALKMVTVPTRVDYNHEEGWELVNALVELGEPVAPPLSYDIDFVRSFADGTILAATSAGSRASVEILQLTEFLLKCLNIQLPMPSKPRPSAALSRTSHGMIPDLTRKGGVSRTKMWEGGRAAMT